MKATYKSLNKPIANHPHRAFLDAAHKIMKDDSHITHEDRKVANSPVGYRKNEWVDYKTKHQEKTHTDQGFVSHHTSTGPDVEKNMRLDNKKIDSVKNLAKKHGFVKTNKDHILEHPDTKAKLYLHHHVRSYHPHDRFGSFELKTPYHNFEKSKVNEEAPTNAVGGGAIAGVGVGPQGEPGKKLIPFKMFRRKNVKSK